MLRMVSAWRLFAGKVFSAAGKTLIAGWWVHFSYVCLLIFLMMLCLISLSQRTYQKQFIRSNFSVSKTDGRIWFGNEILKGQTSLNKICTWNVSVVLNCCLLLCTVKKGLCCSICIFLATYCATVLLLMGEMGLWMCSCNEAMEVCKPTLFCELLRWKKMAGRKCMWLKPGSCFDFGVI